MASPIEMSLEDIIKKKKEVGRSKGLKPKKHVSPMQQKQIMTDARSKIISRKRTHITDAREILAGMAMQKDARLKLEQLRMQRMTRPEVQYKKKFQYQTKYTRTFTNKDRVFIDPSRQVVSQPLHNARIKRYVNNNQSMKNREFGSRFKDDVPRMKPILRTVSNDLEIVDDPMGQDEYTPPRSDPLIRKASLQLKIIAHNNDLRESRHTTSHRTAIMEKDKSPPRPPSILKKRPMAALRSDQKLASEKSSAEYRIIVSNLRNSVTGGDIQELFGDVGGMVESRLVRPGTAEVIYKTQEDAQRAVDLYHNRQLDGQPMNCLLVTPRSSAVQSKNTTKSALYSTNSNVEPDISTFHKVLFSNL